MDRFRLTVTVAIFSAASLFAQNATIDSLIDPLANDLNAFASSICKDTASETLQTALAGDVVGEAAFEKAFPHFTIILPSLGVSLGNGIGTALNDGAYDWEFITPIPNLITDGVEGNGFASKVYDLSRTMYPYLGLSAGVGVGITRDIEVYCVGMIFPQSLTDALVQTINAETLSDLKPEFSSGNLLIKARKVFFRDEGKWPAMSISLGGALSGNTIGANIDLKEIQGEEVDLGNGIGLNLTGPAEFKSNALGFGMDFAVSKKFSIFIPFARMGVWYTHSTSSTNFDFDSTFSIESTDNQGNTTYTYQTKNISIKPSKTFDSIAGRIGFGTDTKIGPFIFNITADIDMNNPMIDFVHSSFEGLTIASGCRLAF